MNRKRGISNRKTHSRIRRVLAVVLALAMTFSLSGFTILAEEVTEAGSEPEVISYTADADGIVVSVDVPAGVLPDGAELYVTLQDEDETAPLSDAETEPVEAAAFTFGAGSPEEEVSGELDLDIFFQADGVEVEPEESAEVTIDASQALADRGCEPESLEVWHMVETEDGTEPVLVAEISDEEEAAAGVVEFSVDSFSEFEFHYTCSAGGWAGFGANLIDENNNTISATVTGYNSALDGGRYTTTVDMPYTFTIEEFVEHFNTNGAYAFQYATVTDPNYGDTSHEFDVWPNEEQVGANELYGSEENPVVSVTIDGTAAADNPNYNTQNVVSKTWHFTLTYKDGNSVTIPIYGNADGVDDTGGKYCPKYLEINLYYKEDKEAVLNLGNGNGTYSDGDYTGSNASGGSALRYGTGALSAYADKDGEVTINLPSDNDLDAEFTVLDAIGTEGEEGYQPAVTIALGKEEAYDYKLIGWINIATGDYYDVSNGATTAEIDPSDDNVFYADWIAASYDHGSSTDANLRDDTVSTSSFVTLRMFDYNELFNLYSTSLEQNGTTGESWTDSQNMYSEPLLGKGADTSGSIADSFIFQNNGTTRGNVHVLAHANPARWNLWTANAAWDGYGEYNFVLDAETYWNITNPSSTILGMLYDTDEKSLGVHYVGDADYLFWVDGNGCYTYDSAVSGASYNQSDGRFYVYDYDSDESSDDKGFFPYNNHKDGRSSSNGLTDYWFGVSMEVNIYLPSATSAGSEENPVNQIQNDQGEEQDMVFDFSGDDDIMIFIDDKMVVDMSGIHSASYSRINFSTNTVTYSMGLDENGAPDTTGAGGKYSIDENLDLSAGGHTMQIFYMERGAGASNLKIQFNVAPVWEYETGLVQTVTAEKVWENADGSVITDTAEMPDVEVGLFDALSEETDDTFGYTKNGSEYTVTYEDDSGIERTYVYDKDGPSLTYSENGSEPVTDNETNDIGQVLDKEGYVVAWLDGETLHIRIDKQTLGEANGWTYAWELLDPDGVYEALELSEANWYTTSSTSEGLTSYAYWSVIGDAELEDILGYQNENQDGDPVPIILTEAAQEAESTLGDTKEAIGYVIVADENGVSTQKVKFSQKATLKAVEDSSGQTTFWQGTYGVTSQSAVEALGSGALWYAEGAGDTRRDSAGEEEGFYLYCELGEGDNPQTYYLTLDESEGTTGETEYSLTVTSDETKKSEFYYDLLGELLISLNSDESKDDSKDENTSENESENGSLRVEIDDEGNINIAEAEFWAATDDVRIYTLSATETSGFAFTASNAFVPIDIEGSKTWDDNDNQDGVRPKSITIRLWADGTTLNPTLVETQVVTPDEDGNWTWTFKDLPKYRSDGTEIIYNVTEDIVDNYDTVYSDDGLNVTNTHTPETVDISGTKTWDDGDNQDGMRPTEITIHLFADGEEIDSFTVTADGISVLMPSTPLYLADGDTNTWNWTISDLPKYAGIDEDTGEVHEIVYTIKEEAVDGYITTADGYDITNTHIPETIDIEGEKVWDDADNQDGIRPDYIIVHLLADGEPALDENGQEITAIVTQDDWSWSFTDLPKYANGEEIVYTIEEELPATVSEGAYTSETTTDSETGKITITNTHTPETIDIKGSKKWTDGDNHEGYRPESITVNLLADGSPVLDEEDNPVTAVVTAEDNWAWSFTDLPKYRDGGVEIVYTITEDAIPHYETSITKNDDGSYTITNTHTLNQTSLTVTKAWDDVDNQDGIRPTSITVQLYADGVAVEGETAVLNEDNNWTYTFTGLDMYQYATETETKIVYTVQEVKEEGTESAYTSVTTGDAQTGYVITNSHTPETIALSGTKVWNDHDNLNKERPDSVTIRLLADGTEVDSVTVSEEDGWDWSFNDLPKYAAGEEIIYTITEDPVAHYTPEITLDEESGTYTVTNKYTPGKTSVVVAKDWEDNNNQDGKRPESITVQLYANGEPALNENGEEITLTLNDENSWAGTFTDLDIVDENDKKISYTVAETEVSDGYECHIVQPDEDNYWFTLVNLYQPEQTEVTVHKFWADQNDAEELRPDSITVTLTGTYTDDNGEEQSVDQIVKTITAQDDWTAEFYNLPVYAAVGHEITYAVSEVAVDGYAMSGGELEKNEDGSYTVYITNTHTPESTAVSGKKTWEDNDDQDGKRPSEITIRLLADGEPALDENGEAITATVTAADNWSWSFANLPKYTDEGEKIVYTILENTVDDYVTSYDGYNVTNTHTPEQTSVSVTKVWDDNGNQDGICPASVTM